MAEPAQRWARSYFAARRIRDRLLAFAASASDGVFVGLMDRESMAAVDELFYSSRSEELDGTRKRYTDEEWNLRGFFDWEAAAVSEHFPPAARVLVTGAGGGRGVLALLDAGFDAYGFEPHPQLVDSGARLLSARGYAGRLKQDARDTVPPADQPFDCVLVGWGSYMLIPGRDRRVAFLRSLHDAVSLGGTLLLSFWVRSQIPEGHLRVVAGLRPLSGACEDWSR